MASLLQQPPRQPGPSVAPCQGPQPRRKQGKSRLGAAIWAAELMP